MAGLVPAIHVLMGRRRKTWMPGTRPGMTTDRLSMLESVADLRHVARAIGWARADKHAAVSHSLPQSQRCERPAPANAIEPRRTVIKQNSNGSRDHEQTRIPAHQPRALRRALRQLHRRQIRRAALRKI